MKNKKQESFDIEEEGIEEKILSLDALLEQDIRDGVDDMINNLIEEIFGW